MGYIKLLLQNQQQLLITACVYLGPLLNGYSLGWSSPIIIKLSDVKQSPFKNYVSDNLISFTATAIYIGQIIGPMLILNVSDTKGRKPCLVISTVITSLSYFILASATNIWTIIFGRIICGLGISMSYVLASMYIGEISSTNIRGILLNGSGVFLTFGCLLVYSVGPFVPYYAVNLLGLLIALAQLAAVHYIVPESPIFHAMQGMDKEAASTLETLNRHEDIDLVVSGAKSEKFSGSLYKELFTVRSNRRAFFITMPLAVLQQLSGIIVVTFYATSIFYMTGSSLDARIDTILIGLTQFVASTFCPLLVERSGRKMLLMISTSICSISLAVLGVFLYLSWTSNIIVDSILWLPLVSLIVYFIGLETGFGVIPTTLPGEMFSPNVRAIGTMIGYQIAMVFGLVLSAVFPLMLDDMGPHITFWIFSFVCAFTCVFTMVFVPETRGKTLFEIQEILSR
ncbi:facilitated trehalose transporter Tret1 [Amyelois transitella]|uniref:facilitated trehalose transporter Tret1 n=1 Tax=Amyelois transitella TaxID=680683 RepID=UPI00298FAF81|nr:facilitated trehalose transporter Tret1 [Amyelois transitella]XP_013188111.2 facilitated trehalose transporter Tret1 [Amyelois transitella]XP_060807006.1 facilitated trehalose transporter Tret1 [Amyelois transitella]